MSGPLATRGISGPLVVVPCHAGDQDQALRLLLWIGELGRVPANAMLFCSNECDISSLMQAGQLAFSSIRHEMDGEAIKCNWQSDDPGARDPSGPNSIFRQVAWSVYMGKAKPSWLFLEPDSVPLTRDWYYVLADEYKNCGKPIMGDLVSQNSPHLSGVAIYPYNVPEMFPRMVHNVQGAFDTSSAKEVLEKAHITTRIMDRWRNPEFKNLEDFNEKVRPECCLFHADKSGSLIPILRQKLGMKGGDESFATQPQYTATVPVLKTQEAENHKWNSLPVQSTVASNGAAKSNPSSAPVVDIYLKTYPKDYELANYCLKSIAKFVTGHRRIIVECPRGDESWDDAFVIRSSDREPGYIHQQAAKLGAFKHTDADYLLYVDSDCCFQRPFDASEMFREGKSTWQYTPLEKARHDQIVWVPVMERFLGRQAPNEFMRRHPHILPRWLPEEMDKFCRYKHGKSLDEYIMAQGDPSKPLQLSFSEFNCAGFFAWEFFKDRFSWVTDAEATPAPLVQGFTHGGPDRIQADIEQFRKILGEDNPKWAPVPDFTGEIEWDTAAVTLAEVIEYLVSEAAKSPLHKARLWKRITAALGMEKPVQGPKRRRKGSGKSGVEKRLRVKAEEQAMLDAKMEFKMPEGWVPVRRKPGRPRKAA